jgi:hypothetical protein
MTKLDCNVVNCSYNEDSCCKRTDIQIDGSKAKSPSETSCRSFAPKGCNCSNSAGSGKAEKNTAVSCTACDCKYNQKNSCSASHIGIAGGHADSSRETECQSFSCCC